MITDLLRQFVFGKIYTDEDGQTWVLIDSLGIAKDGKSAFYLAVMGDAPMPPGVKLIQAPVGLHLEPREEEEEEED